MSESGPSFNPDQAAPNPDQFLQGPSAGDIQSAQEKLDRLNVNSQGRLYDTSNGKMVAESAKEQAQTTADQAIMSDDESLVAYQMQSSLRQGEMPVRRKNFNQSYKEEVSSLKEKVEGRVDLHEKTKAAKKAEHASKGADYRSRRQAILDKKMAAELADVIPEVTPDLQKKKPTETFRSYDKDERRRELKDALRAGHITSEEFAEADARLWEKHKLRAADVIQAEAEAQSVERRRQEIIKNGGPAAIEFQKREAAARAEAAAVEAKKAAFRRRVAGDQPEPKPEKQWPEWTKQPAHISNKEWLGMSVYDKKKLYEELNAPPTNPQHANNGEGAVNRLDVIGTPNPDAVHLIGPDGAHFFIDRKSDGESVSTADAAEAARSVLGVDGSVHLDEGEVAHLRNGEPEQEPSEAVYEPRSMRWGNGETDPWAALGGEAPGPGNFLPSWLSREGQARQAGDQATADAEELINEAQGGRLFGRIMDKARQLKQSLRNQWIKAGFKADQKLGQAVDASGRAARRGRRQSVDLADKTEIAKMWNSLTPQKRVLIMVAGGGVLMTAGVMPVLVGAGIGAIWAARGRIDSSRTKAFGSAYSGSREGDYTRIIADSKRGDRKINRAERRNLTGRSERLKSRGKLPPNFVPPQVQEEWLAEKTENGVSMASGRKVQARKKS